MSASTAVWILKANTKSSITAISVPVRACSLIGSLWFDKRAALRPFYAVVLGTYVNTKSRNMSKRSPRKRSKSPRKRSESPNKKSTRRPRTLDIVVTAILAQQKPRKGCSANAIRNYVKRTYSLAPRSLNTMVRRAIQSGLKTGAILRAKGDKGTGAVGRFRAVKSKKPPVRKRGRKKSRAPARKKRSKSPKRLKRSNVPRTARPKTIDIVVLAIRKRKDPKGCSAQAIRNFIKSTYNVPVRSLNTMVRRAILSGLATGVVVRAKGDNSTGASGRFRAGKPKLFRKPGAKKSSPKKKGRKSPAKRSKTTRSSAKSR